jgi:Ricin-type beta-trefoil lectin domain-like
LLTGDRLGVSHAFFGQQTTRAERGTLMNIKLPARHRDESRRPRRAARLSAVLAVLAVPALLGVTLAGTASASTAFSTHLNPDNTFYLVLDVSGASMYPGAPVIDWYENGGANQDWLFAPVQGTSNTYEIVNLNSNMCLTTDGVAGD